MNAPSIKATPKTRAEPPKKNLYLKGNGNAAECLACKAKADLSHPPRCRIMEHVASGIRRKAQTLQGRPMTIRQKRKAIRDLAVHIVDIARR